MALNADAIRERLARALPTDLELGEPIGSGAFGVVFRAHDRVLERDVAIKVLDPDLGASEDLQEKFLREARIICRVEHPHIVPLYSAEAHDGLLYLVMRLLPGRTLAERIASEKQLPARDAARLAHEIAQALAAAHDRGVIHRDIKPANILIDRDGHAIVTDFGISRLKEGSGETPGVSAGTPGYMSPEQILGGDIDGRSDVYALGVVLFETLTGRMPFTAPSVPGVIHQHLTEQPPRVATLRPLVPTALARIVDAALEKDQSKRPSARDLVRELEAARTPEALLSPPAARWHRFRRRIPLIAMAGVAVGLVWLGFLIFAQLMESMSTGAAPRLEAAREAIPTTLIDSLRSAGVLRSGETPSYVFAPSGANSALLLVTDSGTVLVNGSETRRYARDDNLTFETVMPNPRISGSHGFAIMNIEGRKPDTLFFGLSGVEVSRLRAWWNYSPTRTVPGTRTVRYSVDDVTVEWVPLLATVAALGATAAGWVVLRRRRRRPHEGAN